MRNSTKVLIVEVIVPVILLYLYSNFVLGSDNMFAFWDNYRPGRGTSTTTHVEKQMLHIEADSRLNHPDHKVVFLGTSSVVNGLDVSLIEMIWKAKGIDAKPVNYGLTGLMAYELPFLKRLYLRPEVKQIVFLYNTFCFSDILHPQAASIRFDTYEFVRNGVWKRSTSDQFFSGMFGELFFVIRYRGVLKDIIVRALKGQLSEVPHSYDFEPGLPQRGKRMVKKESPARHWLRDAYVTSETEKNTISYVGLERFFYLAENAGINVIVGAIPVPDFARMNRFRVGVDHEFVDKRLQDIAESWQIPVFQRGEVRTIEKDDKLFWDRIHLHDSGRAIYSWQLAHKLIPYITES